MIDYVLEICKDMKLETIYAITLQDNFQAISLMKKMGFTVKYSDDQVKMEQLQTEQKEPGEAGIVQGQPA